MFSNPLIRSKCSTSNESKLRLSKEDWNIVLQANEKFAEAPSNWRGSRAWGAYLCNKLGALSKHLDFEDSLELCCGNGYLYFSFYEMFNLKQKTCSFIDLSAWQCEKFAERCEETGLEIPQIICGDIGKLPFEDGTLKLVYGNSFLHHLPDVGEYLREVNRVLAPGGKFIAFHEPSPTAIFWESFPLALLKKLKTDSLTDIWLIKPQVISELLQESGFCKVTIFPSNLLASMLVVPWQLVGAKLGLPFHSNASIKPRMICDRVERLLPRSFRMRNAPSLAIYAEK